MSVFFEVTTVVVGAATSIPVVVRATKDWLTARRSYIHIKVTFSDGKELTVTASNVDSRQIVQLLTAVQDEEQAVQEKAVPNGENP